MNPVDMLGFGPIHDKNTGLRYDSTQLERDTQAALQAYAGKLEALGTADDIALEFEGRQVRGFCCQPQTCAIAEDLRAFLREAGINPVYVEVAGVLRAGNAIGDVHGKTMVRSVWCHTPANAIQFLREFDDGKYEKLLDPTDNTGLARVMEYRAEHRPL